MKISPDLSIDKLYQEYATFKYYWDSYTTEEREKLLKDFKQRLYHLG
ncbi:hypothetical protein GILI108418_04260 [Gillisia limnaea]|uniref:Uncharacterized protein n=1 Tax=Gillisia limnaea (strain DSM 15749 / LMG 21470 / R-8282) TaxID=865937 RepID=H2BVB6_GILLR|nr:hypothetical protein Gilli_1107 [Gillisia limnaea DSM 15749]